MFEKESLYFSTLLPEIQEFLEAQPGYDGFLKGLVPKCYYSSDQFIVFENLLSDGYVMLNKIDRHDLHTTD
ncbi:unnamed protein product [Allacma fusca]|uniref:Uncharacterized protein n=1 Tax=Allacma fusca TaxID=39272 RepID=A0A8J2KJ00_9HEXA|nr:unnamed protein product [Allacma fusca]